MKRQYFESPFSDGYLKAVHESGLEIYIMEKPQFSSSYTLFGTKYGSIDTAFATDKSEKITVPEGIAHFLEHKLFESEERDAFERFAETGASANAFTSFDRTCYLFSCSERFDENLKILLDFVQSPYFTEQTVSKEQGIIGQEIRMYDDSPAWRVMFNMLSAMYKDHPVRIDIAGTVDSIAQITADLLYKCYNTFYNLSNMYICIAGNIDTENTLRLIEAQLKPCEKQEIIRYGYPENERVQKPYVEQCLPVSLPIFNLGFKRNIQSGEVSLKEKVCMELLLEIICGESSPLYASLVNEGLINDEFSSEYFTGRGFAAVIISGESTDPKKVASKIKSRISKLADEGIDKKLFSAVKCELYGDAVRRYNTVEGSAMQLVDGAVSGYDIFDEIKILKSVTPDDVFRNLAYLDCNNTVLSVIKPEEEQK